MLDTISNVGNILLMIAGFGFIIAIHELGHFLTARWAGIRVHAFAVGFGSALFSWRKGLGLRRGSSEAEYLKLTKNGTVRVDARDFNAISHTEYRLNWFPFGGYVKMLGQEDANPGAVSQSPDSFSAKPVWKRMIVISGGVVMNLILAAVLFVIAYSYGIREPRAIIGSVAHGSPAQAAGFKPGDQVLAINGEPIHNFGELGLEVALSAGGDSLNFQVQRVGHAEPVNLQVEPKKSDEGMLAIGVGSARSAMVNDIFGSRAERTEFLEILKSLGLSELTPGMRLISIDGVRIPGAGADEALATPLQEAVDASEGRALELLFAEDASPRTVTLTVTPTPEFQVARTKIDEFTGGFQHLLGLTPVSPVMEVLEGGGKQAGLMAGDVLVRVGAIEWPSIPYAMAQIRAARNGTIDLVVLRDGERVTINAPVDSTGKVGFRFSELGASPPILALSPTILPDEESASSKSDAAPKAMVEPAAARLTPPMLPGSRVVSVDGSTRPISTFGDVRAALREATLSAAHAGTGAQVALTLQLPLADVEEGAQERVTLELLPQEVAALHALSWRADSIMDSFSIAFFLDYGRNPYDALTKGVRKTHQIITSTYLTFLRLFQQTVPADQLRGPVGITHIGSRVAGQGFIYLLFFLGLISANLAVINFLPLPIVDGGLFIFLMIEGITKKPVSIAVQNIATILGLGLIGAVFLFVTYNDVMRLMS